MDIYSPKIRPPSISTDALPPASARLADRPAAIGFHPPAIPSRRRLTAAALTSRCIAHHRTFIADRLPCQEL